MSQDSNPNLRTVQALLKIELADMFNSWEASKPLRVGAPHASSILAPESEWCLRRHVLTAVYPDVAERPEVKPWDSLKNARFLNGWVLHEKWQKLFKDHASVVEVEESHYDETRFLHFTPDAIIQWGGHRYVVEIKGYKAETYDKLDEDGPAPEAAMLQCNLYCHLLGIGRGIILVENKNTQDFKLWVIEADKELAKPYTDRMYEVKSRTTLARAGKPLPSKACKTQGEIRAQQCPMRKLCFSSRLES